MTRIRAIGIDFEGCISEAGGGRVSWPTKNILRLGVLLRVLYQETGICAFLVTGRQAPYAEAALQALGVVTDIPSVVENGSILYYPKTKEFVLNPAITESALSRFLGVRQQIIDTTKKYPCVRELGKEFMLSFSVHHGTIEASELAQNIIKEVDDLIKLGIIEVTHSKSAVDVTIRGVNKGSGLDYWSHETKIAIENLAGVGDSEGDLPTLDRVKMPMSPANVTQGAKKVVLSHGGYVSPYPTTQGVIDCVTRATDNSRVHLLAAKFIEEITIERPTEDTHKLVFER